MLVMETESGKEEASSSTKGIPEKEEGVVAEAAAEVVVLAKEEEDKAHSEGEEAVVLPDEEDLETCVLKGEGSEERETLGLSGSELVVETEVEEELDPLKAEEDLLKEAESMLVEVAAGHCIEGSCGGVEGAESEDIGSKGERKSPAQAGNNDPAEFGSEDSGDVEEDEGRMKDISKAESLFKVAGQLGIKESPAEISDKKNNGHSKEAFSNSKVKKEPKEISDETSKITCNIGGEGNIAGEQGSDVVGVVKVEPQEEVEESVGKVGGVKGDVDSSNPASDEYEEEGQEDGAEETQEEESHGEKRSCLDDSGGGSSEESGEVCCKRRRVEGGAEESGHLGTEGSKECLLMGTEKEGGGSDESLDRKMERLRKEIHMLGVMAKQKEAEWDEIIRAKKVKEESLLRLRRRRRIAAIGREVALAERRRHRREGRRARTEADVTSEEEGTDEEWYMQIRGMTGGPTHHLGSRTHAVGGSGQRTASGRTPLRNIPSTTSSFLLGMNPSSLVHSTIAQSPTSTSSIPSMVSSTFMQRMHRPILPKPPSIPGTPMNRRNVMQHSNPVSVTASMTNPLLPATIPSNGGLTGNGCNPLDGTQNVNQVIGEGRQGPILDVRSIIADYRSRHPETVPLRGRRNKSLTPSPATAMTSREGLSTGGGGSDGGPSDVSATPEGSVTSATAAPGILNIASLALGSGSQVRTRGIQSQDGSSPDISYLLLSAGNGCTPGGSLPIRHQQQSARDSSRPSSTESSRSGGQAVPPVTLPTGALVDGSGNFSFKDVLVQFARMSQTEQHQQMMAVIPGMGGQGLLSAATSLQPQVSAQARQPRHILPSTTSSSVLPGPLVTPTRPPPPPYPEVTLLPVLVAGGNEGSTLRPAVPTEAMPQRSNLPPPTPSLLQMSLSAPTSSPQAPSPPSTSLLHGILTKSGGIGSTGLGSSPGGATPRATAFAPTLARLLTAPEKQPSLGPVRPSPPSTAGSSVLGSQAFVSIGELLSTSKAKNEITITPVSGAVAQSSVLKQQQPCGGRAIKEEPAAHMEEEQDDSTDRLVIDESAASEADGRRQSQASRQAPAVAPSLAPEVVQEPVEEGIADEEVEEEEVAMEEEEGMEEEGAMEDEEEEGEEGPVPECQGCHSRAAQFVCAGCGNQWYCSRDCQVSAWDEHSEVCSG